MFGIDNHTSLLHRVCRFAIQNFRPRKYKKAQMSGSDKHPSLTQGDKKVFLSPAFESVQILKDLHFFFQRIFFQKMEQKHKNQPI